MATWARTFGCRCPCWPSPPSPVWRSSRPLPQRRRGAPSRFRPAVTVGTVGNEPLVRAAPDGTLYISALQHLFVSTDDGHTWTKSPGSVYSETANVASDSSIGIDSTGKLYQTFDYPYAGNTALCTSVDKGQTFSCNPAVLPGGTDRMWFALKDTTTSYIVTNEALYQTVFGVSTDGGTAYVPTETAAPLIDPTDGPLLVSPTTGAVVQPIIDNATNQTASTNFESGPGVLRVYDPSGVNGVAQTNYPIPLEAGGALPGGAYGRDGVLYVTSEKATRDASGTITDVGVEVARSTDDGKTWNVLPTVPGTTTGTSTFVGIAAGKAGHFGVVFYRAAAAGDPGALDAATSWDAVYAETFDAQDPVPTWTTDVVDTNVHLGVICATAGCMGSGRFSGDFIDTTFDSQDRPSIAWEADSSGAALVRYTGLVAPPAAVTAPAAPGAPAVPPVVAPVAPPTVVTTGKGSLASTGGSPELVVVAAALVAGGVLVRRRRT